MRTRRLRFRPAAGGSIATVGSSRGDGWGWRMPRLPKVVTGVASALVWCIGAAAALVWGWRFGWVHGPLPGGCGCFNPADLVLSVVWGVLGALAAVVVWSALVGAVGLAVFLRLGTAASSHPPVAATTPTTRLEPTDQCSPARRPRTSTASPMRPSAMSTADGTRRGERQGSKAP